MMENFLIPGVYVCVVGWGCSVISYKRRLGLFFGGYFFLNFNILGVFIKYIFGEIFLGV